MLETLKNHGRKLVTIIDPHTKINEDNWLYKESKEKRLNILD